MTPILHLNLKRKWFDMIKSGEKKEEYRDISKHREKRFRKMLCKYSFYMIYIKREFWFPSQIIICFSNGYSKNRDQFKIKCTGLRIGKGKEEWGADPDKQYFILSLGNII